MIMPNIRIIAFVHDFLDPSLYIYLLRMRTIWRMKTKGTREFYKRMNERERERECV